MKLNIRRAVPSDLEGVFELAKEFVMSFAISRSDFEENFIKMISLEDVLFLVIENESDLLGYCLAFDHLTFFANGRVTWLEEITVRNGNRGLGLGKLLMKEVENWALKRKSKLVALATRRASDFYKYLNYEESAIYFRKIIS